MSTPTWRYTLAETTLGAEEQAAVQEVMASAWLSMGPRTQAFEAAFADKLGARHAVAVSNGTAALHLAFLAAGIGPGDEVIQPSLTFVASANMTLAVGAVPVFADICSLTDPTIDPQDVARKITPRTKAIVVMHYGGYPARIAELKALADAHGLTLIEDACHGPAQTVPELENRALGTFGAMGTFSFFANKNMTTGEGGIVVTDDDDLAAAVRALRSHGMSTMTWDRHKGRASTYDVARHGFNYRIDELRSAIGLAQLAKLDAANAGRRAVAAEYARNFATAGLPGVAYVNGDRPLAGSGHIAGLIVPRAARDGVRETLKAEGIQTSLHYPPIHQFSAYAKLCDGIELALTEELAERVITLPIHPGLTAQDVGIICDVLFGALSAKAA